MLIDFIDVIIGLSFALFLTIAIELLVIYMFKLKSNKVIVVAILVNFATNLTMNLLLRLVFHDRYYLWLGILEVLVFIVEALAYNIVLKNYKKSFTLSLACNSASLAVVLALNWIFSQNFIYTALWWVVSGLGALIASTFAQPYYGAITEIKVYTSDYVEISGIYMDDYSIMDYFEINPLNHYESPQIINSPAPVETYYTVPVSAGDSLIVRLKVEIEESNYQFDYLRAEGRDYLDSDLYDVIYGDDYIYIDILYESIIDEEEGYSFHRINFVSLLIDDNQAKRVDFDTTQHVMVMGYCFFYGAIDELQLNKNENI